MLYVVLVSKILEPSMGYKRSDSNFIQTRTLKQIDDTIG